MSDLPRCRQFETPDVSVHNCALISEASGRTSDRTGNRRIYCTVSYSAQPLRSGGGRTADCDAPKRGACNHSFSDAANCTCRKHQLLTIVRPHEAEDLASDARHATKITRCGIPDG